MRISDWSSDVCSSDLAADIDGRALARVALDLHARNALERVDDRDVGQLADILGRDRIDDRGRLTLEIDRLFLRSTDAGDDDRVVLAVIDARRRRRGDGRFGRRLRLDRKRTRLNSSP